MPYVDLNVQAAARVTSAELQQLGYAFVGVNTEFESGGKLKEASTVQDLPTSLQDKTSRKAAKMYAAMPANGLQLKSARRNQQNIQQLKRITVKVDDMNAAQAVNNSAVLKTYDLVAAEASSAKVFQFLCEQGEIDILTFDLTNRLPFQIKRPWIDVAIKRSIYIEITYAPCLGDSAGRRYFFSNASNLVRVTSGRHLLLSSGATRDIVLRAPYDVTNMGLLIGLTYPQALHAVSTAGIEVLKHAAKRRGLAGLVMESADVDMEH